jgi:esterase/lipase superfamily enzyme
MMKPSSQSSFETILYEKRNATAHVTLNPSNVVKSLSRKAISELTKHVSAAAIVTLTLACGACSFRPSQGALIPVAASAEGTSRVAILAATTRRRSTTDPGEMFNGERADVVSYASVVVSIPPDSSRKIGEVQWPAVLPGDPRREFVTVSASYLAGQDFTAAVSATAKQTGHTKVLVFVHGFNNRFDDAVYRFAQIVHDSGAPVVPVLFTWPSRGQVRLGAYAYDRESANYSRDALEHLLDTLAAQSSVTEISILAHSMGNLVTLEALRARSIRAGRIGDKVAHVMLVAPDVDVDVFRTQIRRMGAARPQFFLLVSQDDSVLGLSQFIFGGVPRLGEIDPTQEPYRTEFQQQRVEVLDLTNLATNDGNAHDKAFEDVTSVVAMLKQRFRQGQRMGDPGSNLADGLQTVVH